MPAASARAAVRAPARSASRSGRRPCTARRRETARPRRPRCRGAPDGREDVRQGLKAAVRVPREAARAELVLNEKDERIPPGHVRRIAMLRSAARVGTRLLIRERCRHGRDPEGHRQRADSSSGLHCRGGWPRRADVSGDEPLTDLPWRPKQLERMRLRYPCRATCQCATATPMRDGSADGSGRLVRHPPGMKGADP